ncbi:hypothetical protein B296_00029670 [Ensete ventricosum]|uniref:Uncharacterized protein n=1 Tax=Ensete ventricosum TaxID=4639 RepID=A0A426XL40_ENSVE|nr:hypothetical protein B296_00029670 [Ensete ventricosum]
MIYVRPPSLGFQQYLRRGGKSRWAANFACRGRTNGGRFGEEGATWRDSSLLLSLLLHGAGACAYARNDALMSACMHGDEIRCDS